MSSGAQVTAFAEAGRFVLLFTGRRLLALECFRLISLVHESVPFRTSPVAKNGVSFGIMLLDLLAATRRWPTHERSLK